MEHLGLEGLAALFILLPGFLCARLVQSLYVRPKQTELDKVTESLLYSFVIYVVFVALFGGAMPVGLVTQQVEGVTQYGVQLKAKPLVELATISFLLAFSIGAIVTNDISGKVFRYLRLTQRTTRSSVWSDTFHDLGGVLLVELGDGRRVMGWVRYYSDEPKNASLFLENAVWVDADLETTPIDGPGILITQSLGINWIEFLHYSERDDSSVLHLGSPSNS
jgi:Family of unknown function (DUF6338)